RTHRRGRPAVCTWTLPAHRAPQRNGFPSTNRKSRISRSGSHCATSDECGQILRADTNSVDDADMGKQMGRRPLVDCGTADSEQVRDLADGEELLDWR